ncbi:MAG: site-specific DNA-methyltransferase [Verrucomicrobia bacterium]|nr:site-specific DNA-methyltransferase [Verrucomicrobiota bacterium]MBI3869946.1 site-specific DNA-methyltransferase [Verrucomicrobiota bacterium]
MSPDPIDAPPAPAKGRAPNNRTLTLSDAERAALRPRLLRSEEVSCGKVPEGALICGDTFDVLPRLPAGFVDLLIVDPPYNLTKKFGPETFRERASSDYESWLESWLTESKRLLAPQASLYVCGDWRSSGSLQRCLERHFHIQNRITWEREKGRGAMRNFKNASEDIWFCTMNPEAYYFDVESVKLRRRVLAPYREGGQPKDWEETPEGNHRLTHPSNLWTDLTVPFWSMPENTDHPTQKPEKLIAKLILASSRKGGMVLDPFLGSGTTAVVAKKLGRRFVGIEREEEYLLWALKRLDRADEDATIQGYQNSVFWERNTLREQTQESADRPSPEPSVPQVRDSDALQRRLF